MPSDRPIVHVVPAEPWGGIQALVPMLAREQIRQGKRVRLLCLGPGTRIRTLARDCGLADVTRSLAGIRAPWQLLRALLGAPRAIVHSHCEPSWASAIIAPVARRRWIEHAHVYPDTATAFRNRVVRALQRRFAARHIAISDSIGRALLDTGMARRATLDVVHNGIAITAPAAPRHPRAAGFTVGFIGRVVAEKGIFDFLDLAARLADDAGIAFAVYGDGADLVAARDRAGAAGLGDRVVFHGHVADIDAAWRTLDVAAIFSHREPFGLVFLEAALHDVPTISYDNDSGGSEVAACLRSAHRVAQGDLAAAAAIVRAHAADCAPAPASAAALAQDRATIAERFSITRMAQQVDAAYRRLDALETSCS